MITIRPAASRGHAHFGWLDSRHSFSFGDYYDPEHMGVSRLRVINDDHVAPGGGFPTHGHRDMEILSYVLSGTISHKDSLGHEASVSAGEFQLMNAGTGIRHSEYNRHDQPLHFLQIWLVPEQQGLTPSYQQARFDGHGKVLVLSPDGEAGSLKVHQDSRLYRLTLAAGEQLSHPLAANRVGYVQVVSGQWQINGSSVGPGDGVRAAAGTALRFEAVSDGELLLFDLP